MLTLISSKTCPFAHRVEIVRKLAHMEDEIKVIFVDPIFGKEGWMFEPSDSSFAPHSVKELYNRYEPQRDRNFSIPILINEENDDFYTDSLKICGMLMPSLFKDEYKDLLQDFDTRFSKAHYLAGHAKTDDDYASNYKLVFEYLRDLNDTLTNTYILGDEMTIIDVVVYAHLCRFDAIYYTLFKLNDKHIRDYPFIHNIYCE